MHKIFQKSANVLFGVVQKLESQMKRWKNVQKIPAKKPKCANLVDLEKCCKTHIYYLLAKIGFDAAENEPSKIWQTFGNIGKFSEVGGRDLVIAALRLHLRARAQSGFSDPGGVW